MTECQGRFGAPAPRGFESVLAAANVSRSSFYAHFADKTALLIALAETALAEIAASGATWWQSTHELGPEPAADTVLDLKGGHGDS